RRLGVRRQAAALQGSLEANFLTRRVVIAHGAAPAATGPREDAHVFVSEKHRRLMAPVAFHHVRIAEGRVGAEEFRRAFPFVAPEIFTAEHSPGSVSDDLPVHR
ncbi:MAG TPA: hypothetical protein VGK04_12585, partial [Thermoanaerobaculia bacterium]